MSTRFLEIYEIQNILGIGRNKVYALIRSGEIAAFKIGQEWKVTENALEEYIKNKSADNHKTEKR